MSRAAREYEPRCHYLALDQGGHASRALLFDSAGEIVAAAEHEITTDRHGEDCVEHDPLELVETLQAAAEEALDAISTEARGHIVAGLATQRSSLVCWDRETGEPLSPVLSWQDRRGAAWLDARVPPDSELRRSIYEETGLAVSPHYGASKFQWCLRELPEVERARSRERLAMGPLASYLLSALLVERPFVVDPANAARTQLCSLETSRWSDSLLDLFEIPADLLPTIQPNSSAFGTLELDAPRPIPVHLCTGDQSAALFAFGEPPAGRLSVNAGTGVFLQMLVPAGIRVPGLLTATVHEGDGEFYRGVEGAVNGGGAALREVADQVGVDRATLHDGLERWAAPTAESRSPEPPLFLNGVSGLASPFWEHAFPTRFAEVRPEHSPPDRLVAVLESIVFLVVENLLAIRASGVEVSEIVLTGGLASSDAFCARLGALTRLPIHLPHEREATARGVAWRLGCQALSGLPAGTPSRAGAESGSWTEPFEARFARWRVAMREAL